MDRWRAVGRTAFLAAGLAGAFVSPVPAHAFRVFDVGTFLGAEDPYYLRWDAAPRTVQSRERSLDGGLRYSLEGGSYEAFRDQFTWDALPTVEEFTAAVEGAFGAWEATDPVTGLASALSFVADLSTVPVDRPSDPNNPASAVGVNPGAEIDIFADTPHLGPGYGGSAVIFVDLSFGLTLTTNASDYPGLAISGADIRINPAFTYSLDFFRVLLTHEIGHAIGLADDEIFTGTNSSFLDDDLDLTSSATALATLTNSFALEIDPYDPDASPLLRFADTLYSDPGLLTFGVDLLMESSFNGGFLVSADPTLQNDDFAGRQFLYPVPEPALAALLALGLVASLARR